MFQYVMFQSHQPFLQNNKINLIRDMSNHPVILGVVFCAFIFVGHSETLLLIGVLIIVSNVHWMLSKIKNEMFAIS